MREASSLGVGCGLHLIASSCSIFLKSIFSISRSEFGVRASFAAALLIAMTISMTLSIKNGKDHLNKSI